MRFDDYWKEIDKLNILSNQAIKHLPDSLSENTKRKLMRKSSEDAARLLDATINEIEYGSTESVETLIRKKL